jgi:hypothetical protein
LKYSGVGIDGNEFPEVVKLQFVAGRVPVEVQDAAPDY